MTSQSDNQPQEQQEQPLPEGTSGADSAPEYVPTEHDLYELFEYRQSWVNNKRRGIPVKSKEEREQERNTQLEIQKAVQKALEETLKRMNDEDK